MNKQKREQIVAWLESMPWWAELPYAQLEARATSLDSLALSEKVRGDELEAENAALKRGQGGDWVPMLVHEQEVAQLEEKLAAFRTEAAQLGVDFAQLEADKDRLLGQLVAGEELYISRGMEIAKLEADLNAYKERYGDMKEKLRTVRMMPLANVVPVIDALLKGEADGR